MSFFGVFLNRRCSFLSILDLISVGLLIVYTHRYDVTRSINVYYTMSLIGLAFGNGLWLLLQYLSEINYLPSCLFSLPIIIIGIMLLAYKRNEHNEIWEGLFYDMEFMDPAIKPSMDFESVYDRKVLFEGLNYDNKDNLNYRSINIESSNEEQTKFKKDLANEALQNLAKLRKTNQVDS